MAFFLQGLLLGFSAAASPGPFQTFIINQTLQGGRHKSTPIAFAPLISDGPIIFFVTLLLDRLPPLFLRLVSLGGGIFVLYLAWGLWQNWYQGDRFQPVEEAQSRSKNVLWKGVIMNAMSPGPYTFWAFVTGPILLEALRISWFQGGAFLAGFYIAMIGALLGIILLFDQARRLGRRLVRLMLLVSIVILVIFGVLLIKNAVTMSI
jgi:threonine/homoserine/homoserine lactone efflux protein